MSEHLSVRDFPLPSEVLDAWWGACLELVNDLLWSHPEGQVLYVEDLPEDSPWRWHAALLLDGLVYDAWHPHVRLSPVEYVREVFGPGTKWEVITDEEEF